MKDTAKNPNAQAIIALAETLRAQAEVLSTIALTIGTTPAEDEQLLDIKQAAKLAQSSPSTIRMWIDDGLPAVKGSRRKALVRRSDLLKWLEARPVEVRPARPRKATPANDLDSWDAQVAAELGDGR